MNLNVNIDIDDILNSIDVKDLEQYIRRRKLEEINNSNSVIINSASTTIPLNLPNKIKLDNLDFNLDLFDDEPCDEFDFDDDESFKL
jgi:hypothetical protein